MGGGGSILAVPLLLYFVGLENSPDAAHVAIGTTALAVGVNAYVNSYIHLRKRNVSPCIGLVFAWVGLFGSLTGAYLGRITPGRSLLTYFAIAMITLGVYMAARKEAPRAGTIHEVDRVVKAFEECRVITNAPRDKVRVIYGLITVSVGVYMLVKVQGLM